MNSANFCDRESHEEVIPNVSLFRRVEWTSARSARPIFGPNTMTRTDEHILDVLQGRASWQKGKAHIDIDEVVELLARRFPDVPKPTAADVVAGIQRLRDRRAITWAAVDGGRIFFIT